MPTPQQLENKLTPAAKQALDELVDDYRTQLLLGAGDSASRLGELREISVHDIVAAVGSRQRQLFGRARSPFERILGVYALTGALVAAVGLIWFVAESIAELREIGPRPSLLAAAAGLFIAVVSYLMLRTRKRTFYPSRRELEERPREYHGLYLAQWIEIEMALRKVAAVKFGESTAGVPIFRLIERLTSEGMLSADEHGQLLQFLELRNALAHGRSADTHERQIMEASREADRILRRLRGMS